MPLIWVRSSGGAAAAVVGPRRGRLCSGSLLLVELHQALPVALAGEGCLHRPRRHVARWRHVGIVERSADLRLVRFGQRGVGRDAGRGQGTRRLGSDPDQLGQVVAGRRCHGGCLLCRRGLLRGFLDLDLEVGDHLVATQRFGGGLDECPECSRGLGGQRARDEQGVLGLDRLLDQPDRRGPVPVYCTNKALLPFSISFETCFMNLSSMPMSWKRLRRLWRSPPAAPATTAPAGPAMIVPTTTPIAVATDAALQCPRSRV